jgi:hypothetical protein
LMKPEARRKRRFVSCNPRSFARTVACSRFVTLLFWSMPETSTNVAMSFTGNASGSTIMWPRLFQLSAYCGASGAIRRTIVVRHLRIVVSPVCGGGICEFAALLRVIEAQCRSWPDARHVRFSEKNCKPRNVGITCTSAAYCWGGMHGTFNGIPLKEIIALKNKWSDFQPLLHTVAVSSRGSSLRLHDLSREIHHFEINVGLP